MIQIYKLRRSGLEKRFPKKRENFQIIYLNHVAHDWKERPEGRLRRKKYKVMKNVYSSIKHEAGIKLKCIK